MRFTSVILGVLFCLNATAQDAADATSDEALIQAAEKLVSESHRSKAARMSKATVEEDDSTTEAGVKPSTAEAVLAAQKESEIPVALTAPAKSKDTSNLMWRLAASMAFLSVIAGLLYYATRRWTRPKDKAAQGARIEMVHQFHMGPRKSVALIRVAGETILLGVTDTNINMIKPVTLIDDELEGLMKKDFNNFLEDEFSIEDVRSALRA